MRGARLRRRLRPPGDLDIDVGPGKQPAPEDGRALARGLLDMLVENPIAGGQLQQLGAGRQQDVFGGAAAPAGAGVEIVGDRAPVVALGMDIVDHFRDGRQFPGADEQDHVLQLFRRQIEQVLARQPAGQVRLLQSGVGRRFQPQRLGNPVVSALPGFAQPFDQVPPRERWGQGRRRD